MLFRSSTSQHKDQNCAEKGFTKDRRSHHIPTSATFQPPAITQQLPSIYPAISPFYLRRPASLAPSSHQRIHTMTPRPRMPSISLRPSIRSRTSSHSNMLHARSPALGSPSPGGGIERSSYFMTSASASSPSAEMARYGGCTSNPWMNGESPRPPSTTPFRSLVALYRSGALRRWHGPHGVSDPGLLGPGGRARAYGG